MEKILQYIINNTDRGIICVQIYIDGMIYTEIECFEYSPYSIEEEIQNWLDESEFRDEEFLFQKVEEKTSDEVIEMITETLAQTDGNFIQEIANSVITQSVHYVGDSLFLVSCT
jgi:hypothetical protein